MIAAGARSRAGDGHRRLPSRDLSDAARFPSGASRCWHGGRRIRAASCRSTSCALTRSLRQSAKRFEIRVDTCFGDGDPECANPARPSAWICAGIHRAYTRLHELGWAHSIEVFDRKGALAGGLYGVRINGLFAGESMFHLQRDAPRWRSRRWSI